MQTRIAPFVVKANGSVMTKQGANAWFGKRVGITQIEAGDVIVVPVDIKADSLSGKPHLWYTDYLPARCCSCCGKFLLKLKNLALGHFVQKYLNKDFLSVNLFFREQLYRNRFIIIGTN